jgi:5-methylcytosine-specific restriction endonuclease McrA
MPIKPENKHRYPKNWKQIRAAILERAGHRCERCGVPNHVWRPRKREAWTDDIGQAETWAMEGEKVSMIVLTIAHLDHVPENCAPGNLAAMCQRCHLRYDAGHHRKTAYKTRRNGKAAGDLFAA